MVSLKFSKMRLFLAAGYYCLFIYANCHPLVGLFSHPFDSVEAGQPCQWFLYGGTIKTVYISWEGVLTDVAVWMYGLILIFWGGLRLKIQDRSHQK